jgi:hypothetical protein
VTCIHATVMTHWYVFKKKKKKGRHIGVIIDEVSSSTLVEDFSLSRLKTPNNLEMKT